MTDRSRFAAAEDRQDGRRERSDVLLAFLIVISVIAHGVVIRYAEFDRKRDLPPIELTLRTLPRKTAPRKRPDKPAPPEALKRVVPHVTRPVPPPVPRPVVREDPVPDPPVIREKTAPVEVAASMPAAPVVRSLPLGIRRPERQEARTVEKDAADNNGPAASPEPRSDHGPELRNYLRLIRQRIGRYKKYPLAARRRRIEGRVGIHFTVSATGELQEIKVSRTSGHRLLDRAALRAVRAASPLPPPPVGLSAGNQVVGLSIVFELSR
ncbi:TonB family protein [Desulfolithobacter sp.]